MKSDDVADLLESLVARFESSPPFIDGGPRLGLNQLGITALRHHSRIRTVLYWAMGVT